VWSRPAKLEELLAKKRAHLASKSNDNNKPKKK
jgi:hypothetical protein